MPLLIIYVLYLHNSCTTAPLNTSSPPRPILKSLLLYETDKYDSQYSPHSFPQASWDVMQPVSTCSSSYSPTPTAAAVTPYSNLGKQQSYFSAVGRQQTVTVFAFHIVLSTTVSQREWLNTMKEGYTLPHSSCALTHIRNSGVSQDPQIAFQSSFKPFPISVSKAESYST